MDWRAVAVGLVMASYAGPSWAVTTLCDGGRCFVITEGNAREMSRAEVRQKTRDEATSHLLAIDCDAANVPPACRHAIELLMRNFYGSPGQ